MIKWLPRLVFIAWEAIIFVASANEEILYGWQSHAASAPTTGHAAFPPVERESCTAENTLNPSEKARLQPDGSDDDLLKIGLGTTGAYPSYPSSFGQSSRSRVIPVLTKKPFHLTNSHKNFKLQTYDHRLFPSAGVSLEQVNAQARSISKRREFLSDFDKIRQADASASTEHYIPLPTNPPESLSESFNLGRKPQLQSDAHITRGPLGNSGTHEQDETSGTKRKLLSSWGDSLSLKTGVTSGENDAQHSYATPILQSGLPLKKLNMLSAQENHIASPQFKPQEIQQVTPILQLGSNTPPYQNAGATMEPVLSSGGRKPWEMSSIAGQNGGNFLLSLKPPEKGENGKIWGANQEKNSSFRSQPQHTLRSEKNILLDWHRSTEPLLDQSPRPKQNVFESGNQGSSSEDPENIPQVSKIPKPHQQETITNVDNHPSHMDGTKSYGRIKFNTDILKGEGPIISHVVGLLNSIPRPHQGNYFLTNDQLKIACESLRRRHSGFIPRPSMHEIRIFMSNINRWYQYWNTHTKIDVKSLHPAEEASKHTFVFPLFLLYVEMIISIIPCKQGLKMGDELNYPQEMGNAIGSYLTFCTFMKNPPQNGESKIWKEKQESFKRASSHAYQEPSVIIWKFIEFWMENHYTAFWNKVKENNGLHVSKNVKRFFNTIFNYGIETLNQKI